MGTNGTDGYGAAVERYFAAWNAPDEQTRAKAVAAAWTEDGTYTDPMTDVAGHEALGAAITAVREQFPGHSFQRTGEVEGHHDLARFTWDLVAADGSSPAAGSDVVTLAEDGRIVSVKGFLDRLPGA